MIAMVETAMTIMCWSCPPVVYAFRRGKQTQRIGPPFPASNPNVRCGSGAAITSRPGSRHATLAQEPTRWSSEKGGNRTSAFLAREPRCRYDESLSMLWRFKRTDHLACVPIYENITFGPVTFEQIGLTVVELSDFDFSLSIIAEKQMARSK